jgi:polysaccharide chain length determinant protein (PEP-CTERM system associated)
MLKAQQAEETQAQLQDEAGVDRPVQQNPLDLNPVYQNMRIQLSNVEVEIAALRAERDQQQAEVEQLRRLVDTVPQVEAELNRLNRDYDVVRVKHQELLQRLETANIGEDVSRSIDDVQFRIIDPPFADATPTGPERPLFLTMVLFFAIGAGGGLAFVVNQLKPTFIGNRSVTEVLGIPVLASVSLLQTDAERRSEKLNRYALQAVAALLVVSFVIVSLFAQTGSGLLRQLMAGIT